MKRFSACCSDETKVYEGSTEAFWDLWALEEDGPSWRRTIIGDYDLDDALRFLGVPEGVITEETDAFGPYSRVWTFESEGLL